MLNAEDRFASLSQEPEYRALLKDAKPAVLYDLQEPRCLWGNIAAARAFGDGGLHSILEQPLEGFANSLNDLRTLAGRLMQDGQKTLARLRLRNGISSALATVSVQRKSLITGEKLILIRFLDLKEEKIDDAAQRRFFFGYDDVRNAIFPADDRQVELPFERPRRQRLDMAQSIETPHSETENEPQNLTPEEEDKFKAIADALGMKLNEGDVPSEEENIISEDQDEIVARDVAPEVENIEAEDARVERNIDDHEEPEGVGEEKPEQIRLVVTQAEDDETAQENVIALKDLPRSPDIREKKGDEKGNLIELFAWRNKTNDLPRNQDWQPILLVQDDTLVEANKAALDLFAVETDRELGESDGFSKLVENLTQDASSIIELYNSAGEALRLEVDAKPLEKEMEGAHILLINKLASDDLKDIEQGSLETFDVDSLDDESAGAFEIQDPQPIDYEEETDKLLEDALEDLEDRTFIAAEFSHAAHETGKAPQLLDSGSARVAELEEEVADLQTMCEELERSLMIAKAREKELHGVLGTATDGVLIMDEKAHIISMNSGAEALLGREERHALGRHFTELLTPESRGAARSYFEGVAGYSVTSLINDGREVKGLIGDGKESAIALFLSIGRLGDGEYARFCAVLRDITPWKKTEAELMEARRRAEAASQQKTEFLAKVSHEVRTPLNAIIGFSDVMLEERFGPFTNQRYRSYMQDIKQGGQYVISLVNDLLDLAKVESGRMELNFEEVNLNDLVQGVQSMLQTQATSNRVIMRYSLGESLPNVVADLRSVKQILINILSNAVKFTEPGGQVIVSTRKEDDGGLAIRIRDTGCGMSPEEVAIALKPFRQVGSGKSKGGTGLGLPLSRALTEANRARFEIESEKDVGTTVSIVFPVQQVCTKSSKA